MYNTTVKDWQYNYEEASSKSKFSRYEEEQ